MTIHMRNDSDGNVYQIWAQRQANSCAVASMWMARNRALQMTVDESEWQLAWRTYQHAVRGIEWDATGAPPAPMTIDPRAYRANQRSFYNMFGSFGTYSRQAARALESDGLTVDYLEFTGTCRILDPLRLSETTPAIVLFGWYGTDRRGRLVRRGGHFVVAARQVRSGDIVYLNPWGGVLQELPNDGRLPRTGLLEEILYISA